MNAKKLKTLMDGSAAWLYSKEMSMLESFLRQVGQGRKLSARQLQAFRRIEGRVPKRKQPRVFLGGSPGGGRRR